MRKMTNLTVSPDIKFYDTSSLLLKSNTLFDDNEFFVISSVTLEELENIKNSLTRDADIKYAARKLIQSLDENEDKYDVHIFKENMLLPIKEKDLSINNDMKILATAIDYNNNIKQDEVIFVSNDRCLKRIANLFFGNGMIMSVGEDDDDYKGYLDYSFTDSEMEQFYSHPNSNTLNAYINQYIIIRNRDEEIVDKRVWTGQTYRPISYDVFDSKHFGRVKPIDIQQQFAADSFMHNKITMIKGPAGSGKTLLTLGFLFSQLEKGKIDKIIVFCNTVAAKNSARLGFLPGTRDEKLLDSQIGNLLISKIGGRTEVERLVDEEKLVLLPMSDIRGYDTTGMRAGIYISEAQNLDISLMKLALQRIGEDSICVIDGDEKTQVDDVAFAGANNGMRRASKVFRGSDVYGEVALTQIHRSKIAEIAQRM